jgi:hypothetical protein
MWKTFQRASGRQGSGDFLGTVIAVKFGVIIRENG